MNARRCVLRSKGVSTADFAEYSDTALRKAITPTILVCRDGLLRRRSPRRPKMEARQGEGGDPGPIWTIRSHLINVDESE